MAIGKNAVKVIFYLTLPLFFVVFMLVWCFLLTDEDRENWGLLFGD